MVQVSGLHKGGDGGATGGIGFHAQGGAEVDFTEAQAGGGEAIEGDGGGFEFHAEMATVVVDADVTEKAVGFDGGVTGAPAVEEGDGLGGGFEITTRLGFEAEVEVATGAD